MYIASTVQLGEGQSNELLEQAKNIGVSEEEKTAEKEVAASAEPAAGSYESFMMQFGARKGGLRGPTPPIVNSE